jgi:3-methyl-2-oxobutanoate hydroxymethyltransferase
MIKEKVTTHTILGMKKKGEKIAAITAYDAIFAGLMENAGIDIILVGDSLGMVFQGRENTLGVTLEHVIYHTAAVSRAKPGAMVIADMPFMSYQVSGEQALVSAGRLVQEAGAEGVKLEGGESIREQVEAIVRAGIPVMGHLGLVPQSILKFGGYRIQGKKDRDAEKIVKDAKLLEELGCFSMVLEKIPLELAQQVTEQIGIPTIGIGAGPHCDGQILVMHDLLGLYQEFSPKFVRKYAELGKLTVDAVKEYIRDVKAGSFPSKEESFLKKGN